MLSLTKNFVNNQKNKIRVFLKNGMFLPFLFIFLFYKTNHLFLSSIITLKLYPTNYFFWFYKSYYYIKPPYQFYNQIKQFVRLTDTSHLASFIYYYYPPFFPIAFNIHFIITVGYWTGKILLNAKDSDDIGYEYEYVYWYNNTLVYLIHGFPLVLLVRELYITPQSTQCYNYFTNADLMYTYLWGTMWIVFIYIPWRFITNDPVYTFLSKETPFFTKFLVIYMMYFFAFMSNDIGFLLNKMLCNLHV